jgi:uncharacterized protein with HEPN domain
MSKSPLEYLRHIFQETSFIMAKVGSISEADFYADATLTRAIVRSLEIIGEASKNIPANFKERNAEIDWKNTARMRDKLIHHYFGVDYSIVWDVMKNEIPLLHNRIAALIQSEEKNIGESPSYN